MKRLLTGVAAIAVLMMASCDSKTKLAEELAGSWSGTPERIGNDSTGVMTMLETFNFTPNENESGGQFIVQATISVVGTVPSDDEVVEPFSVNQDAIASAQGKWQTLDDDEVMIVIDPQTITVNVDPKDVVFSDNVFTGEQQPAVDSIQPKAAEKLTRIITKEVTEKFLNLNHLDDVKVKENLLKYEIGHKHFRMSKQTEQL